MGKKHAEPVRVDLADRIDLAEHLRTMHGAEPAVPAKGAVKVLRQAWKHLRSTEHGKATAQAMARQQVQLRQHVSLHFHEAMGRRAQAVPHYHAAPQED